MELGAAVARGAMLSTVFQLCNHDFECAYTGTTYQVSALDVFLNLKYTLGHHETGPNSTGQVHAFPYINTLLSTSHCDKFSYESRQVLK